MDILPAAQAVEALIHEYGKLVFHTIYGLTGDWEESQDLTQDTFHQALKSIDAARAKSGERFQAKAWLLRIALNTALMQRRRRNLFRFIPLSRMQKRETGEHETGYAEALETLNERAAAIQPGGYGIAESPDLEAQVAEQDAVRRTLARLSEPLRLCLVLSIIGQFSSGEIARMLDLEEAAVRQRLARARKQFQEAYRLESGEEVYDQHAAPTTPRPLQSEQESREAFTERVESHDLSKPSQTHLATYGRTHAERLYRYPAVTPLR